VEASNSRKKFLEKFHELVRRYERLHEDHEYKPHKVAVSSFYNNFLRKLKDYLGEIKSPQIKAIIEKLRIKIEYLADFKERRRLHDLAEKMVKRLNEIGLEFYGLSDLEFIMETTKKIDLNVLVSCCPEFNCKNLDKGKQLFCNGTIQQVAIEPGQDTQQAIRLYYEKYCRNCEKLAIIENEVNNLPQTGNGGFTF